MQQKNIFNVRAILPIITLAVILIACADEEVTITPIVTPPTPEKITPISDGDHLVYAALNESIEGILVPKVIMADGTVLQLTDGKHGGQGTALVVDDEKNTFMSGFHYTSTQRSYALYWKNTVPVLLTDTVKDAASFATDIALSGEDIYVVGYVGMTGVYWKNGVRVDLSDGKTPVATNSIFVAGNDVYVTGAFKNPTNNQYEACYWKNGEQIKLLGASTADVLVNGEDLYVTGSFGQGKYWKNGSYITLEAMEGGTGDILFSNGSVYITGVGRYWKDGVTVNMFTETSKPRLFSIAVLDEVVYLGGFDYINGINKPQIWKNGKAISVTDGKHNGAVSAICVVRK